MWLLKGLGTSTHGNTQAEQPDGHLLAWMRLSDGRIEIPFLFLIWLLCHFQHRPLPPQPGSRLVPGRYQAAFQLLNFFQLNLSPSCSHSTVLFQLVSEEIQHRPHTGLICTVRLWGERCEEEFVLSPGPLIPHENLE